MGFNSGFKGLKNFSYGVAAKYCPNTVQIYPRLQKYWTENCGSRSTWS